MKIRYLIILAVLATIFGVISLGINHQHAVTAAQHIIAEDKAGTDTKAEIADLTAYVHSHTRASVSFSLDGSYERAVQAAEQAATPQANASVYPAALAACQVANPVTTAQCIQNYVQSHVPAGSNPQPAVLPDHKLYVYQLNAPAWAPDGPGLAFLVALVSLVTAVWLWAFGRS